MQRFSTLTSMTAGRAEDFVRDESGATSIEYALIASGLSIVILAAVTSVGSALQTTYATVAAGLK